MKFALLAVLLFGAAFAKKGGDENKVEVDDKNIVNPDDSADNTNTAEFTVGMTEGDIMPNGNNGEDRNAVSDPNKLWTGGVVPYVIDSSVQQQMRSQIDAAMRDYHANTCIKFVKRTNQAAYVDINSRESGCYAWLGRAGRKQPLNLQYPGCEHKGTIIHEMLHTLGFAHEQSRNDRDKYITINWNNIKSNMHSQFKKLTASEENNQGFGYDYNSVMHYPDWGFQVARGRPAITTKDPSKQKVIGQRKGFSTQDIQEVNKLYKCNGKTSGLSGGNNGGNSGGSSGGGGGSNYGCADQYPSGCSQMLRGGTSVCRDRVSVNGRSAGTVRDICKKSCRAC